MADDMIVWHCSPTMAGLKTANMFTMEAGNRKKLNKEIRRLNRMLVPRGIRLIPLRYLGERVLLYMYRPDRLSHDLSDALAIEILTQKKYPVEDCNHCIMELIKRLQKEEEFPHEIGLFLGYPAEDVQGFMENNARSAKCVGTWKVYGDEEKAREKFEMYKKCKEIYWDIFCKYHSIDRLLVAVS